MGGMMSRRKGAGGELEIIKLLQPIVDEVCAELGKARIELIKDTRQRYEKKRYDIFGLPWMALEIKRVENQSGLGGWWRQVKEATQPGQTSVLAYRQNHMPWKVRMRVYISVVKGGWTDGRDGRESIYVKPVRVLMTVDVTWEQFIVWFRQRVIAEFK